MVLKIVAIGILVIGGWWFASPHPDFVAPVQSSTE
jgi:hypothetical protein